MASDGGIPFANGTEAGLGDGTVKRGEGGNSAGAAELFTNEVEKGAPGLAGPSDGDGTILGEGGKIGEGFVRERAPLVKRPIVAAKTGAFLERLGSGTYVCSGPRGRESKSVSARASCLRHSRRRWKSAVLHEEPTVHLACQSLE